MSVSVCVCVCVCLTAIIISQELHVRSSPIFVHVVARSSPGGVVIRYALPVLWMTSYLLISQIAGRRRPAEAQCTRSLGLGYVRSNTSCRSTDARDYFLGAYSNFPVASPGAESAIYDCLVNERIALIYAYFCCGVSCTGSVPMDHNGVRGRRLSTGPAQTGADSRGIHLHYYSRNSQRFRLSALREKASSRHQRW